MPPSALGYGPFETINGGKTPSFPATRALVERREFEEMLKFPALNRPGAIAAIVTVWVVSHSPLAPAFRAVGGRGEPC